MEEIMKNGFKKLPFDWREAALKLSGIQLKVWLAHYWRSDKDDKVEMSNSQIMRECDLGLSAVKEAKRWLKENGWLIMDKESYRDPVTNQWVSPELIAACPGLESSPRVEIQPTPGLESSPGPKVEIQPTEPRVEFPPAGKSTLPVYPVFAEVNTGGSDAARLPVNTEAEAEEEQTASASEEVLSAEEQELDLNYRNHSIDDYLVPIANNFNLNGNRREEAEKLYDLLQEVGFPDSQIAAVIEYHRSVPDPFMANRISTWSGLFSMLRKDGLVQQFRSAEKLALKLNPNAFHAAQEKGYGTSAYGAAIAKIIEDKKAKAKTNRSGSDNPGHTSGGFLEEAAAKEKAKGAEAKKAAVIR
jgi:hypothetical protein